SCRRRPPARSSAFACASSKRPRARTRGDPRAGHANRSPSVPRPTGTLALHVPRAGLRPPLLLYLRARVPAALGLSPLRVFDLRTPPRPLRRGRRVPLPGSKGGAIGLQADGGGHG